MALSIIAMLGQWWKVAVEDQPVWVAFGLYPFLAQWLTYWIFNLPFIGYQYFKSREKSGEHVSGLALRFINFMDQFSINPSHSPADSKFYWRLLIHCSKLHFLMALPMSILNASVMNSMHERSFETLMSDFGWFWIPKVIMYYLVFMACDDGLFYLTHYILHKSSFLYKNIHSLHHELRYTVSVGCEFAHPLEFLFGNIVPVLLGPTLLRVHLFWYCLWISFKIMETSYVHSGFDFKLLENPLHWLTNEHAYHHSHYQDNYGSWHGVMDLIFGTSKHYDEYAIKKKNKDNSKKEN